MSTCLSNCSCSAGNDASSSAAAISTTPVIRAARWCGLLRSSALARLPP
ncbi:Uncharacterised protein [Mycobacteroides abscessus subsp. abscessus]|nr:Uncharacterised protein [Mycobacteroides abscessus subsp. abscessus]